MTNKAIPKSIEEEAQKALSFFPQLQDVTIAFKFKSDIKKSTMQAQPVWGSFLKPKSKREYVILISETFKITGESFKTIDVPKKVMIGWLGHELGHIMDYQSMNHFQLIVFGIKYLLSHKFIVHAERCADEYAVKNGMAEYILETKNYILNHADISPAYKARINKYYLSPEEIMHLVEDANPKPLE